MKNPPTLIDAVYAKTFDKPGNPELRKLLMQARRCVLTDEMSAFMYSMMVTMLDVNRPYSSPLVKRRAYGRTLARLDDCRWFARLPHRVTWVEYSLPAMFEREISDRRKAGDETAGPRLDGKLQDAKMAQARIGWLFIQHDHIDTAFRVQYFLGNHIGSYRYWTEILWCTDDKPLPWHSVDMRELFEPEDFPEQRPLKSASEFVTGLDGYIRSNVGWRWRDGQGAPTQFDFKLDSEMEGTHGRARMMWCFLATFNKVPILGERKVVPSRGFVARGSYRQFLEHSIITVNIPEQAALRKVARDALGLIRRRAHQVRGHWRDDWRKPKGNKALWIAEHQRGDASIGFVTHDYEVHHDDGRGA